MEKIELKKAIAEIKKKFGDDSIGTVDELKDTINVEKISSGSPYLDWALSGGFPKGKLIELYGPFSSGKSLMAYRTLAEAQRHDKECVLFDAEQAFDPDFARLVGVDPDKLVICRDSIGESMFDKLALILQAQPEVVVVDSVAALIPKSELEDEMSQQTIGLHARMMSKALRKINALNKTTCLIFINQIREKVGSYGNPETTTGGRALGFYASVRLEIRRGEFMEQNKKKIGQEIKFKVTKSKVGAPYRDGSIKFFYGGTFDAPDEVISMGMISGKIVRRGAWFDICGETFNGRDALAGRLSSDIDFYNAVVKEVMGGDNEF